jgi:hypothetical protein
MIAQAWVVDPKAELALMDAHLGAVQEAIPGWRLKIHELVEMI